MGPAPARFYILPDETVPIKITFTTSNYKLLLLTVEEFSHLKPIVARASGHASCIFIETEPVSKISAQSNTGKEVKFNLQDSTLTYIHGRRFVVNRRLMSSLFLATDVIDKLASEMCSMPGESHWQKTILGHTFTMSKGSCAEVCDSGTKTVVTAFKSWLQAHEEAQVMLASVLVVVGVWWLVRAVLALLINLLCPILVVLLAVVCVPQLRGPLLGQNYPVVANLMRNILMKMAENIKT